MPALSAQSKTAIIQKIIVKVNGEIFTLTDLTQRQIQALREKNRQVRSAEELQTDAALRQALTELTPSILAEAVDELLLVQRGRELGVKLSDQQFQQAIDNIKKENKLDDAGLAKALSQEGMTLADLRQNFEKTHLMRSVQQNEIMPAMQLTEEEKKQFYQANLKDYMKPSTVTIRELFVEVPVVTKGGQPAVSVGVEDEAKAKIDAARERIVKGEDFAKVVGEVSDAGSKANGGLISGVLVNDLSPALADMLNKLKPGEVSEVLRTAKGFNLFKLEARVESTPEPYDKVRDQIAQRIYEMRMDVETKKFLDKLRIQANIEWKDEGYRLMYEKVRGKTTEAKGPGPMANGRPKAQGQRPTSGRQSTGPLGAELWPLALGPWPCQPCVSAL